MLVEIPDPKTHKVVTTRHTCDYHKRNPNNRSWPGCTCGGSYSLEKIKPEPREVNHHAESE